MTSKFEWLTCDPVKVGSDPNHSLEAQGGVDGPGQVIVGVGARYNDGDLKTLALWIAPIEADGTIGRATEKRFGVDSDHSLEAEAHVGNQEVVTGLGMRAKDGDIPTLVVYGRRLDAGSGRLSTEQSVYRGGEEPDGGLEVDWASCDGAQTVVTSVGLRGSGDDLTTMVLGTGNLVANAQAAA